MNQKKDKSSTDGGKQAVVGVFRKSRKLALSKKQLPTLGRACAAGILIIIIGLLINSAIKNSAHYKTAKVHALVKANDCSAKAQQSISSYKPSTKQVNFSIALLSYQANCLVFSQHYAQANTVLQKLKSYYALKNDTVGIQNVNSQIANNTRAAAIKVPRVTNAKPEIDQFDAKQIQDFYRSNQ